MESTVRLQAAGTPQPQPTSRSVRKQLQQLVALEYGLMDACHEAARMATQEDLAMLADWAGATQVHLFDLGTALRDLGDETPSYSRCMRQALLQSGNHRQACARLERAYERVLERTDMHDGLRTLLRANLMDHRGFMAGSRVSTFSPMRSAA